MISVVAQALRISLAKQERGRATKSNKSGQDFLKDWFAPLHENVCRLVRLFLEENGEWGEGEWQG